MNNPWLTLPIEDPIRNFRGPNWLWYLGLFVVAGPLNPAIWILTAVLPEVFKIGSTEHISKDILLGGVAPATILSIVLTVRLARTNYITSSKIWAVGMQAWILAVISAPIIVALTLGLGNDFESVGDLWATFKGALLFVLFFGILLGVIPIYAIGLGLPCMIVAIAMAYLCTEPVNGPS